MAQKCWEREMCCPQLGAGRKGAVNCLPNFYFSLCSPSSLPTAAPSHCLSLFLVCLSISTSLHLTFLLKKEEMQRKTQNDQEKKKKNIRMAPKSRTLEKWALALDFLTKLEASNKMQEDLKHFRVTLSREQIMDALQPSKNTPSLFLLKPCTQCPSPVGSTSETPLKSTPYSSPVSPTAASLPALRLLHTNSDSGANLCLYKTASAWNPLG